MKELGFTRSTIIYELGDDNLWTIKADDVASIQQEDGTWDKRVISCMSIDKDKLRAIETVRRSMEAKLIVLKGNLFNMPKELSEHELTLPVKDN